MSLELDEYVLIFILAFCRIGACVMQIPGVGSARVPTRIRLFFALTLTAVVTPTISSTDLLTGLAGPKLLAAIFTESFVGFAAGVSARIYLGAMEFAGTIVANMIGLSTPTAGIEHEEQAAIVATLVSATATLVLLLGDLYGTMVSVLLDSYSMLPIGTTTDVASGLRLFVSTLSAAFLLGLQITGPFIVYGIVVNLMFGILGKLVPQIPSYFLSVPFLALGGIALLYFVLPEMLLVYVRAIAELTGRP